MHKIKLIRNVMTMLAIVFISAVLCGAGCSNVAASSGGGGSSSGSSGIVPNISSKEEFDIIGKYNLGGDTLTLNADKTGNFKKLTPSASIRAAGDALTFDASINSLTWSVSGNTVKLSSGGKSVDLTMVASSENNRGANLKKGDQTFTAAEVVMSEIIGKHIAILRPSKEYLNELLLSKVKANETLWYINEATFTNGSAIGDAIIVYIDGENQKHVETVLYPNPNNTSETVSWEIKNGTINFIPPDEQIMTRVDMKLQGNTAFIYYDHIKQTVVYSVSN